MKSPRLGVNIDHVATVRNARGGFHPSPILAAKNAEISSVIVDGGYTNEDCKSLGADFYLYNISELKSVLNL